MQITNFPITIIMKPGSRCLVMWRRRDILAKTGLPLVDFRFARLLRWSLCSDLDIISHLLICTQDSVPWIRSGQCWMICDLGYTNNSTGYSVGSRTPFIHMKVAQWRMKPKWLNFTGLKIPRSEAALPYHWAHRTNALETLFLLLLE